MKKYIYGFIILMLGTHEAYAVNNYRILMLQYMLPIDREMPIIPTCSCIVPPLLEQYSNTFTHITLAPNTTSTLRDSDSYYSMSEEEQA